MTDLDKLLQTAVALHRAGRIDDAEHAYQSILQTNPRHFEALHLSGVIHVQRGNITKAIQLIEAAVQINPKSVTAQYNLGVALTRVSRYADALDSFDRALVLNPQHVEARQKRASTLRDWEMSNTSWLTENCNPCNSLVSNNASDLVSQGNSLFGEGRFDEAVASYDQAIAHDPDHSDAYLNRGVALRKLKRFAEAIASFERALVLNPRDADAYTNLGNVLQDSGRLDEALASHDQALALNPYLDVAHCNRGSVLRQLQRFEDALNACDQAIALNPSDAKPFSIRANVLRDLKRPEEALTSSDQAIAIAPDDADIYLNRGLILEDVQKPNDAFVCYDQAIALKPDYAEAYLNRANILGRLGRCEEALASCDQAIALNPDFAEAHLLRGSVLAKSRRFDEELACYDQAVALKPDYAEAHWNRSLATLLHGDYSNGWQGYEYRWKVSEIKLEWPNLPQPLWQGEALAGKTILLVSEQGLGDTLQFVRYAAELEKLGATVFFECPPPLINILRRCRGIKGLISHGGVLAAFDFFLPLLSAPLRLGTTLQSVPWSGPYLFADDSLTATWRERLDEFPGRKIGLAWQGNHNYAGDRLRSPPLTAFLPLADTPQTTFISLQKGPGTEQLANVADRFPIIEFPTLDEHGAFEDTAAILCNLDLFITSDSAVAHLAGGMGVPTWLVLPYTPDWRWLLDREDSPWYPSLRLFRQKELGNWEEVFQRVWDGLRSLAAGR